MSIRVGTTYLAICDYPGCYLGVRILGTNQESRNQ